MIGTAPLSFDRADEEVEGMIDQGTSFARVEDMIDAAQSRSSTRRPSGSSRGRYATQRSSVAMPGSWRRRSRPTRCDQLS
jgi:hypothetical protein